MSAVSQKAQRAARFALLLAVAIPMGGCMMGPDYKTRDVELPEEWSISTVEVAPTDPTEWWKSFNDPALNGLIETALTQNLDIQTAGLRILQARSSRNLTIWTFLPIPVLQGSATHVDLSQNVKPDVKVSPGQYEIVAQPAIQVVEPPEVSFRDDLNVYSTKAGLVWEPDLWGKVRRTLEASNATLEATQADYDDMAVLTASEVAITYFQIRAAQERIAVLEANIERLEKTSEALDGNEDLTSEEHLTDSLALESRASLSRLRAMHQRLENTLALLLDTTGADIRARIGESGSMPEVPASLDTGVPADLLRRRPDIRKAERVAAAESARIGAIKANALPSLSLSGLIGFSSSKTSDLVTQDSLNGSYGAGANLSGLILYPVINEATRRQDAKFQEAMLNYEKAVKAAVREVEDSMVNFRQSRETAELLTQSAAAANAAADGTIEGFDGSLARFASLYQAQQSALRLSDSVIEARASVAISMVQTFKALGGGWEVLVGKDVIPAEAREEMQERSDWKTFGGKKRLEHPR